MHRDTVCHPNEIARLQKELELERQARTHAEAEARIAREALALGERSEAYFRHLTEYALDLITILDADGTIRFESHSMTRELGWEPQECIGKNAFDFVHPEDELYVMQAFVHALQTNGSTPLLHFRFRHKDGSYRVLEGRGNNLLDAAPVRGIVFNSRDITETRRLQEQFHQSQKVQAIGQLTGGVAHDFNNILTAIIGYTDLALGATGGDPLSHVAEIRKAALRAAALTRQLLAFSRRQVLQPRILNLENVIRDMDQMLRRLLGENIDYLTVIHSPLGNVRVDPSQIEQVLLNLVVNARDAMAGGKLTIEISNVTLDETYASLRADVSPGEYVMLAITDTGTGMPPEVQSRLFEPFFTTKEIGKGTGLGLATSHGIVKQSGGHIAVYTELGIGTTFRVYLPRVDESVDPIRRSEEPATVHTGDATILLVEDEPMLRELGLTVLRELGYQVMVAANGREALQMVASQPDVVIDLLLTDVVMPEMGGMELVEKLRPISPKTRVIYCSGYTEDAIFHNGGLEEGVYFLQKPYTVATVAQKVHDVLKAGAATLP